MLGEMCKRKTVFLNQSIFDWYKAGDSKTKNQATSGPTEATFFTFTQTTKIHSAFS